MAENKVRMTWTLEGSTHTAKIGEKLVYEYSLLKLFPDFLSLSEVQQNIVAYGMKQKLSDGTAKGKESKLTLAEVQEHFKATQEMLESGKWTTGTKAGAKHRHDLALDIFQEMRDGGLKEDSIAKLTVMGKFEHEWKTIKADWLKTKQAGNELVSGVEMPKEPVQAPVVLQSGNDKVKAKTGTNGKVETKRRARSGK